ncbi:MAG: hypothetical protein WC109_01665 [Syntrophomonadaceae bacterium]
MARGFKKHLAQIMNIWEGTQATLKVKTLTKDSDGQVTNLSYASYTITGSFPAMPKSVNKSKTGFIDEGTITAYIMLEDDIPVASIEDKIVFDDNWFEITEEPRIDYDAGEPCGFSCTLVRVPNEA